MSHMKNRCTPHLPPIVRGSFVIAVRTRPGPRPSEFRRHRGWEYAHIDGVHHTYTVSWKGPSTTFLAMCLTPLHALAVRAFPSHTMRGPIFILLNYIFLAMLWLKNYRPHHLHILIRTRPYVYVTSNLPRLRFLFRHFLFWTSTYRLAIAPQGSI
ncbi:hypothetical protein B0H14DRAFT_2770325 [Mycena olivaceomarginata]|nr:hypothetical protein B0H14DRAFT_2770325 [Mycena olivaceomarginata]